MKTIQSINEKITNAIKKFNISHATTKNPSIDDEVTDFVVCVIDGEILEVNEKDIDWRYTLKGNVISHMSVAYRIDERVHIYTFDIEY